MKRNYRNFVYIRRRGLRSLVFVRLPGTVVRAWLTPPSMYHGWTGRVLIRVDRTGQEVQRDFTLARVDQIMRALRINSWYDLVGRRMNAIVTRPPSFHPNCRCSTVPIGGGS